MRKSLLIAALAVGFLRVEAQNYYAISSLGVADYNLNNIIASTKILDKTNNDVLSPTQTIPFTFNFYGTNVTQFKASDNGFITFDLAGTDAGATPAALPSTATPNNAIYAFQNDWELKAPASQPTLISAIYTQTLGTAPNRKFIIQWLNASPMGVSISSNADILAFGIVMYEGGNGKFDIFWTGGHGDATHKGVCGIENSDGTKGLDYGKGTTFAQPYEATADPSLFPKVTFYQGTQASNDMHMVNLSFYSTLNKATDYVVSGNVSNYAKNPVTNFKLNYSINGGAPKVMSITGVNITASGGVYNFNHSAVINEPTAGVIRKLKVWTSNVNGVADENPIDDSASTSYIVINGTTAPKIVMVEEATGSWCQHCPDAHTYIKQIETDFAGKVVVAVHHNSDGMTNTESDAINTAYATGYPNGYIDRTLYSGQSTVGLSRSIWNSTVGTQSSMYTPVKINFKNVSYNTLTRKITYDVEAEFTDYYSGDIRIGAMIKESFIRGTGSPYDQIISSIYTSNSAHVYYGKTSPMGGYYHRNVIINIPSGAWGTVGSIPASVIPGQKVSYTYTYTLPAMTNVTVPTSAQFDPKGAIIGRNKPMDIWLIGFVAKNNTDGTKREILNVGEQQMWNLAAGVSKIIPTTLEVTAYPNPANNAAYMEFTLSVSEKVTVTVTNSLGQVVSEQVINKAPEGLQSVKVATESLANGIYNVSVVSGGFKGSSKLMVNH